MTKKKTYSDVVKAEHCVPRLGSVIKEMSHQLETRKQNWKSNNPGKSIPKDFSNAEERLEQLGYVYRTIGALVDENAILVNTIVDFVEGVNKILTEEGKLPDKLFDMQKKEIEELLKPLQFRYEQILKNYYSDQD